MLKSAKILDAGNFDFFTRGFYDDLRENPIFMIKRFVG